MSLKLLLSLSTLFALLYATVEIKGFLDKNFIENDTPLKEKVNRALNGEYP